MTRRNMMYLFYNLLNADTKDGQVYAQTLGYTLNSNGEIDYLSMVSDTMEGPFVVEGGLSELVSTENKTVYRNGYASTADAVQKYDVIYYNDSTIWAYANAVSGTYQSASPSTSSPTSVTVAGNTYEIRDKRGGVCALGARRTEYRGCGYAAARPRRQGSLCAARGGLCRIGCRCGDCGWYRHIL